MKTSKNYMHNIVIHMQIETRFMFYIGRIFHYAIEVSCSTHILLCSLGSHDTVEIYVLFVHCRFSESDVIASTPSFLQFLSAQ